MARFTMDIGELKGDTKKIEDYLYKLNRTLEYMFNNLNPEDNYSADALLKVVSDGEKQSVIEQTVDGIKLQMVDKDEIVAAINLSREEAQIKAEKISLEGVVTVNSFFQIGLDGSMTARNGNFSGDITASRMFSSSINSTNITLGGSGTAGAMLVLDINNSEIGHWDRNGISLSKGKIDIRRGSEIGLYCDGAYFRFGDFEVNDRYGRQILQASDGRTGLSGDSNVSGALYLWAGYRGPESYVFVVNRGDAYVKKNGTGRAWPIAATLANFEERIEALEEGGDDPNP